MKQGLILSCLFLVFLGASKMNFKPPRAAERLRAIAFDVVSRYANLLRFYKKAACDDEAQWVQSRLVWILGAEKARQIIEPKKAD